MATRRRAPAKRARSAPRRAAPSRVRAAPRRAAKRSTGPKRATSKRGQSVRLVIEHQTTNPVQRPEMDGYIATRNTKKAKF